MGASSLRPQARARRSVEAARRGAFIGLAAALALGFVSRLLPMGSPFWDKSVGDVAYAAMVGFLVVLARPRMQPINVMAVGVMICFVIELFQLTGLPARAPRVVQLLLGTTFAWHDVAYYMVGASLAAFAHSRTRT